MDSPRRPEEETERAEGERSVTQLTSDAIVIDTRQAPYAGTVASSPARIWIVSCDAVPLDLEQPRDERVSAALTGSVSAGHSSSQSKT
jgi:hypothetical protein